MGAAAMLAAGAVGASMVGSFCTGSGAAGQTSAAGDEAGVVNAARLARKRWTGGELRRFFWRWVRFAYSRGAIVRPPVRRPHSARARQARSLCIPGRCAFVVTKAQRARPRPRLSRANAVFIFNEGDFAVGARCAFRRAVCAALDQCNEASFFQNREERLRSVLAVTAAWAAVKSWCTRLAAGRDVFDSSAVWRTIFRSFC
jgi:hypothetical protein